jgi:hypothetical protein
MMTPYHKPTYKLEDPPEEVERLKKMSLIDLYWEYRRVRLYRNMAICSGVITTAASLVFPLVLIFVLYVFMVAVNQHSHLRLVRRELVEQYAEVEKIRNSL